MTLRIVSGDTGPQLRVAVTREDGSVVDLTGAAVSIHVRDGATGALAFTRAMSVTDGPGGVAVAAWGEEDWNREEGTYEGEIEVVSAAGVRETTFDLLRFKVREDFA